MAITNYPPYDHYMHGCDMAYSFDDFKSWKFEAPFCGSPIKLTAI